MQEPFKSGKVLVIKVDVDSHTFDSVEVEDYNSFKRMKYLFSKGPSNGPSPTPTAKITDVKKTFENKILKWFDKHLNVSEVDANFLENIKKILADNKDTITQLIQTCIKDINKKEGKLLTIKIKQDNEWRYSSNCLFERKQGREK